MTTTTSTSRNYLASVNGVFTRDSELGFDPKVFDLNRRLSETDSLRDSVLAYDITNRKWIDERLDVWDIPPSLLLAGICNSHSIGFGMWITNTLNYHDDVSFKFFSIEAARVIDSILHGTNNDHFFKQGFPGLRYLSPKDFENLNREGAIVSTRDWNLTVRSDSLYVISKGDFAGHAFPCIQGVVERCHKLLQQP